MISILLNVNQFTKIVLTYKWTGAIIEVDKEMKGMVDMTIKEMRNEIDRMKQVIYTHVGLFYLNLQR